jgi:hypothetical protein
MWTIAARDEDLGAAHQVAAVGGRLGGGRDVGQARAGVGLGQRHRAGPLAAVQRRHVGRAQGVVAERLEQVRGALGQPEVAVGRQVARHQVGGREREHRERHLRAADRVRPGRGDQAELGHPPVQRPHPGVNDDAALDQARRLGVERAVGRIQLLAGELAGRGQQQLAGLAIVIGKVRQPEQPAEIEDLVEDQLDVAIVDQRVGRGGGHRAASSHAGWRAGSTAPAAWSTIPACTAACW